LVRICRIAASMPQRIGRNHAASRGIIYGPLSRVISLAIITNIMTNRICLGGN
jgi:hypothetical protein